MVRFTYLFLVIFSFFCYIKSGKIDFRYNSAMAQVGFAVSEIKKAFGDVYEAEVATKKLKKKGIRMDYSNNYESTQETPIQQY
jgi:hypothetical protein